MNSANPKTPPALGSIGTNCLLADDVVSVWDLVIPPGEATGWHKHNHDYLFIVLTPGRVYTEYEDGTKEWQDNPAGHVERRPAEAVHRLVNAGSVEYRNIVVELKQKQ